MRPDHRYQMRIVLTAPDLGVAVSEGMRLLGWSDSDVRAAELIVDRGGNMYARNRRTGEAFEVVDIEAMYAIPETY